MCTLADLSQDVLFPHEFLPLSIGGSSDHRQNVLAVVWHHTHKENEILQKLSHKPGTQTKALNTSRNRESCRPSDHLCCDVSIPSFILDNVAVLKLPYSRLQDLAGIVGKVQVSDLRERNGHDGKSLFVLFSWTGTNLLR